MNLKALKNRIRSAILIALYGVGTYSCVATAAEDVEVTLSGSEEVPAVSTSASGTGTISMADDGMITGTITTTGVQGTMAHIHTGAKGANGPPIITLTKSGDTYTVPENSRLTEEQQEMLDNGELYVNVHSAAHPSGEIRAQLEN